MQRYLNIKVNIDESLLVLMIFAFKVVFKATLNSNRFVDNIECRSYNLQRSNMKRFWPGFIDMEYELERQMEFYYFWKTSKLLKGAPWDGGLFSERQNWKTLGWGAVQGTGASLTSCKDSQSDEQIMEQQ
jgi:hypothetical protein